MVSPSDSDVSARVRTHIQQARGRVDRDLSPMGLLSVTSDNPDFKRSIPDALAVAPDMQVDSPRPRIVTGPTVADANHRQLGPPNTGDDDFFLDLESGIAVFEILKATVDHRNGNKKQDPFFGFGRVDATPVDVH